jgi:hypothetical protein
MSISVAYDVGASLNISSAKPSFFVLGGMNFYPAPHGEMNRVVLSTGRFGYNPFEIWIAGGRDEGESHSFGGPT